jgi:hypothetical protein
MTEAISEAMLDQSEPGGLDSLLNRLSAAAGRN